MPPISHVTHRQLEMLIEFVEENASLALNRKGTGPLDSRKANRAWENCARRLNSLGHGLLKTGSQWKRYWHMYKSRTKMKAIEIQRDHDGTGVGPSRTCPLTELEERVVAVIGTESMKSIPVRRLPPTAAASPPRSTRNSQENEDDVPRWAINLEERRMAIEEKLADAVAGIDLTLRRIERRSNATQERMANALIGIEQSTSLLLQLLQRLPTP